LKLNSPYFSLAPPHYFKELDIIFYHTYILRVFSEIPMNTFWNDRSGVSSHRGMNPGNGLLGEDLEAKGSLLSVCPINTGGND
jgi:hypothetical protein